MDFSDTYIQMCEQATELQELWTPVKGDWIVERRLHDGVVTNSGDPFLLHDVVGDNVGCLYIPESYQYAGMVSSKSIMLGWRVGRPYQDTESGDKWWYVWLPKQDQLQALLPASVPLYRILAFGDFLNGHMDCETMEEAWLVNIMCRIHRSYWVNSRWISKG